MHRCQASSQKEGSLQTQFFSVFTAKHFTTVRAGFALTFISWPNITRLPAFVAALCFVLTMTTPGIVNLPVFLISAVAKESAMPPFDMDLTDFIAFIAFIAFLAIA